MDLTRLQMAMEQQAALAVDQRYLVLAVLEHREKETLAVLRQELDRMVAVVAEHLQ